MTATKPIRRVAVVGRGLTGWISALALRRALQGLPAVVELVDLESDLEASGALVALPTVHALHKLLGIDETSVVRSAGAVPMLGRRFSQWSETLPEFVHGFDVQRASIANLDILHYWVKGRAAGLRIPFEQLSLAAAAATQGRIAQGGGGAFRHPLPGYNLDEAGYLALIRQKALDLGVKVQSSGLASVETNGQTISAIALSDGTRLAADLYIDATGPDALLLGRLAGNEWKSWSQYLPCDHLLCASAPRLDPLPAFGQVSALEAGWVSLAPLQDRTAVIGAFASGARTDATTIAAAESALGTSFSDVRITSIAQGIRAQPWIGNCVAIGGGAAMLEPLDAGPLQIIQIGLSLLIGLWPCDANSMPEAEVFNRAMQSHLETIRDFHLAHYQLNGRLGESFWDAARTAATPPSLEARLRLFAARGEVALFENESFDGLDWSAMFLGLGLIPRGYDPRVQRLPEQEQIAGLQNLLRVIAAEVRQMPDLSSYIAKASL